MKALIANGADVNAADKDGSTPLHEVARGGQKEIAAILIAKGANVNAASDSGWTPLHKAAHGLSGSCKHLAELLIAKGANINARNKEGLTPLEVVGRDVVVNDEKEDDEVADLLRKNGAK